MNGSETPKWGLLQALSKAMLERATPPAPTHLVGIHAQSRIRVDLNNPYVRRYLAMSRKNGSMRLGYIKQRQILPDALDQSE